MTRLEYDRRYIWHPYASLKNPPPVRLVESAAGVNLRLNDGKQLVDSVSSWWCVAHGHNHPQIVDAVKSQADKLCHVMFGGFTHDPAIELAERIAEITPKGLNRVFFADSGSISVEVAVKMAIQYQQAKGRGNRGKMLSLKGGYHGDTACAMALSDPDGMHVLFKGMMPQHHFADKPLDEITSEAIAALELIADKYDGEIAGVICEPIFQAANAMNFYDARYLVELRRICDAHDFVLVFDEIAAGFYRTGPLWAHSRSGITPDIMTIGKALTGGHMTLAATIASELVAETISNGNIGAFMHGPTYMANPLACAAANASLQIFKSTNYESAAKRIEGEFKTALKQVVGLPNVKSTRCLGAVGIIEVERMPAQSDIERVIEKHGVWLRPFANYIYAMPPFITDTATINRICDAMIDLASSPPGPELSGDFHE